MTTPNIGIPYVPEGTLDPAAGLNLALNMIDALLQTRVISMALTSPPVSPADGDLYIPAAPATGDWTGLEDYVLRYVEEGDIWQEYEPGAQVHLVLNLSDGGLYKYIPGSPGGWVLAAGLSDAASDGSKYVRRNGAWEALLGTLLLQTTESPPDLSLADVATLLIDQSHLELTSIGAGIASLSARKQFARVVTTSDANVDASPETAGDYTRFSNAAATYTFDDATAFVVNSEYHGRYVGSGTLTITAAGTMTINAPADGSLVIPPQGTFTIKIVAADEADLIGVTEAP